MATAFEVLRCDGRKARSIETMLALLSDQQLIWLLMRTKGYYSEVPDFLAFVTQIALWESKRREDRAGDFPSINALVDGIDLYCDEAINNVYEHILGALPPGDSAIKDVLNAVVVVGMEMPNEIDRGFGSH